MGIRPKGLSFLYSTLAELDMDLFGLRMCELGNMYMRHYSDASNIICTAKDYFTKIGVDHVSIDVNGKDGSLPINLNNEIIDGNLIRTFDIVTNFGTAEHVRNQYMFFKNMHNLCKDGGLFIGLYPHAGYEPAHCSIHYTINFFDELAMSNGYIIVKKQLLKTTVYQLFVSMVKNNKHEFISNDKFVELFNRTCWFKEWKSYKNVKD